MTKRKLILTAICALICCAFMTVTAFAADDVVTVSNGTEFMKAWEQIEKDYAGNIDAVQNTTIKLDGNIDINNELSMNLKGGNVLKVKVDLNGHMLRGASKSADYFFNIGNKLDLTLEDTSSSHNGQIVVLCENTDAAEYKALVRIADSGHFTLESGTIRGNDAEDCGCIIVENNSLFTMSGGIICENSSRPIHGAAVYVVKSGKFIMNGGVIRDNVILGSGAAVFVDTENDNKVQDDFGFEMKGGLITDNDTYATGAGGVYVNDGRASFTGGTVRNNFAATGSYETSAVDDDASEIYIDTGAESCYFGGDFVCEYNSSAYPGKAITVRAQGITGDNVPEFGGRVKIDAIAVEDGLTSGPGIVCKDIDFSAENHAWIGLCEATDNIKIYTDVDEKSDHYAKEPDLTKCFFTCSEETSGREKSMNWERNESMCAVYKDNVLQYIGVVDADDHSEAPICLTSFDKECFVDTSGNVISDTKYNYSWDLKNRAHRVVTNAAVDKSKAINWLKQEYSGNSDKQISGLKKINPDATDKYCVKYSYEVFNTVADGQTQYKRTAYNTLELSKAPTNQIRKSVAMDGEITVDSYREGEPVVIKADYPKNSDCFKGWKVSVDPKYEDVLDDVITAEMKEQEELKFEMPAIPRIDVYAQYDKVYSIAGEGFTAYRVDEAENVQVTEAQVAGRKIKLEANGLGDLSWPRWIINKVDTDEGGNVVNKTDVTSELLGDGITPEFPKFTMPEYDIEVVCSEAGHIVVDSPYASVEVVNTGESKPAGKMAVPYNKDTMLRVTLDETKIPEGHNFLGWDMSFVFTNGDEEDAFEFTPEDGHDSFTLSFAGICDYYVAEDLSDIREIRLTARYDKKIDFDANGGTGEMEADTHNPDHKYGLPACKFTAPEGMRFAGWAHEPDGEPMKAGHAIDVKEDITLYAIWEEIPATVRVDLYANDGTDNVKTIKAASGEYLLPGEIFEAPEGKAFAGWALKTDGEVIADKHITLVYDTDLYAIWKKAEHDFERRTVAPTCTAGGYDILTCKDCGETTTENFTEALGHEWGDYEELAPNGCGNPGVKTRKCNVCGLSETEHVEEAHAFESEFTVDQKATADADGSMSRHCKNCDATTDSETIPAMGKATLAGSAYSYNGTARTPGVTLVDREGNALVEGTDFAVAYKNNINAGTASVIVSGCGKYEGDITVKFNIAKAAQNVKIQSSSGTVKRKAIKKKAQYLSALKVSGAKGTKTFTKVSGSKKLTITKSGKIKVKKGTKKGTYKIKVKLASAATANYKYASTTRTITVKVK